MPNEELQNEIEALNAIYGDGALLPTTEDSVYILRLSSQSISLRLNIPSEYPAIPPLILGTQSSGNTARKGQAARVLDLVRDSVGRLFNPGEVCLFDVIEEVNSLLVDPAPALSDDVDSTPRDVAAP